MSTYYALQVLGIILAMGVLGIGGIKLASMSFDRKTEDDARKAK